MHECITYIYVHIHAYVHTRTEIIFPDITPEKANKILTNMHLYKHATKHKNGGIQTSGRDSLEN